MKNKRTNSNIAVRAGLAAALALALAAPAAAQASTLDELQSRIDASNEAYNAAVQHATELQDKIDANRQKIQEIQAELPAKKEAAAKSLRTAYKMQTNGNDLIQLLLSSDDFNEVISTVQYLDKITSHNNAAIEELAQSSSELEQAQSALASQKAQVDSEVTNAVTALSDANNARQEYESQVAAPSAGDTAKKDAQQPAAPAPEQAPAAPSETKKPEPPADSDVETDGEWMSGLASAYDVDNNTGGTATASGAILTSDSVTVAVPASQSYLLGRSVQIRYGGKTITATVTDTGGFASYGRVLDLAGGCWKAFGFSSCYDWGVRAVQYRFL